MFFSNPSQFSSDAKNNFVSQIALNESLLNKTFENFGKFVDLNLSAARATLDESNVSIKQLMSAKDPREFFSLAAAQAQPTADKALAYVRHVANIAATTHADFAEATHAKIAEMSHAVSGLVDDAGKHAPAGSENIIAVMKTAIKNANAGFEQLSKTSRQSIEVIEEQLEMTEDDVMDATEKPVRRARKQTI